MDVFSRKIVGWEVYDSESTDRAAVVFRKAHLREGINADALVLHSDNGSPMKGATMLATLQKLGVIPSFSRPSVSNDNPYSEALFKTLKYPPGFPDKPFENLEEARQWVTGFVHWYNETHRHSHLRYVTQSQRHRNEDIAILAQRHELYQDARDKHPERWSGKTRNWQPDHRRRSGRHRSHPKLSLALFGYLDILSPQELADIVRIIDLWLRERTDDE